jgi:hypothetical protein
MNIDMIFHGTQPGGQEGRSAEKRGSAPLTFTLGPAVIVLFSVFGFKVACAFKSLF